MNIKDTQCGAKVIRRAAVEKVHSSLCIADMAFDINLLYILKREGFSVWKCRRNGRTRWAPKWLWAGLPYHAAFGDSLAVDLFALRPFGKFSRRWRTGFIGNCMRPRPKAPDPKR